MTDVDGVFADGAHRRAAETALASVTAERPRTVEPLGRGNRKRTALVRFDGRGPVAVDDGALTAQSGDWHGWPAEYGRTAVERLPPDFDPIRGALRAVFAGQSPDQSPPARLFPWDLRPGNAVVADGRVTAVLDWEAPMAAAPALSVAKAEYLVADWYADHPEPLRTASYATAVEPRQRSTDSDAAFLLVGVGSGALAGGPGLDALTRLGVDAHLLAPLLGDPVDGVGTGRVGVLRVVGHPVGTVRLVLRPVRLVRPGDRPVRHDVYHRIRRPVGVADRLADHVASPSAEFRPRRSEH